MLQSQVWLLMASLIQVQLIDFVLVFSLTFIVIHSLSRPAVTLERGSTSSTLAEKFMPSVSVSQVFLSKVPTPTCAIVGILLLSARFLLDVTCVFSTTRTLQINWLKVSTRALRPSTSLPECVRFEWALLRAGGWSIGDKQWQLLLAGLRFTLMVLYSGSTRCSLRWAPLTSRSTPTLNYSYILLFVQIFISFTVLL